MAKGDVVQISEEFAKQLERTVRNDMRRMMNEQPPRQRWSSAMPKRLPCIRYWKLTIEGNPDGGSINVNCGGELTDGTPVSAMANIDWDEDRAGLQSKLRLAIDSDELVVDMFGPFPWNEATIYPPNDVVFWLDTFTLDQNGPLIPFPLIRSCCR